MKHSHWTVGFSHHWNLTGHPYVMTSSRRAKGKSSTSILSSHKYGSKLLHQQIYWQNLKHAESSHWTAKPSTFFCSHTRRRDIWWGAIQHPHTRRGIICRGAFQHPHTRRGIIWRGAFQRPHTRREIVLRGAVPHLHTRRRIVWRGAILHPHPHTEGEITSPVGDWFTSEQEELFRKHVEEKYNLFIDRDYVRWLGIHHPHLLPTSGGSQSDTSVAVHFSSITSETPVTGDTPSSSLSLMSVSKSHGSTISVKSQSTGTQSVHQPQPCCHQLHVHKQQCQNF